MGTLLRWLALSLLFVGTHALAQTGGTVTYVYTDPQGTPLAEADASGNITATFEYTPYGTYAPQGTSMPAPDPNGPGYTGHVNDPETNLVYMQARYYDMTVGRFVSVDPVATAEGDISNFNRYSYATNNPILDTDPTGRYPIGFDDPLEGGSRERMFERYNRCQICLDASGPGGQEIQNLPGVTVTATAPSAGAVAGGAIGFVLSLPVDVFEDLSTAGVGAIANPVTSTAMTAGGAYVGNAAQQGLGNLVQMMSKRFTSHGSNRANEAKTDSHRSVGNQDGVIKNGRKFIDNDTGYTVHVSGDRVVVTNQRGDIVTQVRNTRANTSRRITSGRWTPLD